MTIERDPTRLAVRFVILVGILSFFADCTYEGARSVTGPYLATLQASAFAVGVITGLGELLGYGLRLFSGRWADATRQFWPIAILGYIVQMAAVPALALTDSVPAAAALIILERIGKAIRNPPRDVMLSHAGKQAGGYGWVFGLHESLDQAGAMCGPLLIAFILARRGTYHQAFAVLLVPAVINITLVLVARRAYPHPEDLETTPAEITTRSLPGVYWLYLAGAALVGAAFADYPLIAWHFSQTGSVPKNWIPIFYAIAMAVSGTGSLTLGPLFDRWGFGVLIALTILSALFAPLVFYGGFIAALIGAGIWGLGMGVHESMIPAAVAPMVPTSRRASAFGLFTAGYGAAWFGGSVVIGALLDVSIPATVAFCVVLDLVAVPIFALVSRLRPQQAARSGSQPPNLS